MVADAWNVLTQDDLNKAWNKLLPEERNKTPKQNETDDNPDNDLEEIVEMFLSIPRFSECDREDVESWIQNDIDDPGYQIMNEDEISALVSFLYTCTGRATHPLYCLDRSTVHVL
uniref:DDE-1 domain-containing protein n=1 Tax=Timema genevievae TaxID=629358 RepID=A0A7R9JYK1_TIMGE|nr:unnamed protein product [Timema genevievae]